MNEIPAPEATSALFSHDAVFQGLMEDVRGARPPQGILLSGPKGSGKATLAYKLIRALLSGKPSIAMDDPIARRIAGRSHADLFVLSPLFDEKKQEFAREISVEQGREVAAFLSLTPAESPWRVVLIDAADQLNHFAANAILKILEEPPPRALLILISHQVGALLPTIRSRCRHISCLPLSPADFARAMRPFDLPETDITTLGEMSAYAPGVACEYATLGAAHHYRALLEVAVNPLPARLLAFADQIIVPPIHHSSALFLKLLLFLLERSAKQASGLALHYAFSEEEEALKLLAGRAGAAHFSRKWQEALQQFSVAERLHLDYKPLIMTYLDALLRPEPFIIGSAA